MFRALLAGSASPGHPPASKRSPRAHRCAALWHRRLTRETHGQRLRRSPQANRGAGALWTRKTAKDYSVPDTHSIPRTGPGKGREAPGTRGAPGGRAHAPVPPRPWLGAPLRAAVLRSHLALCPGLLRQPLGPGGEGGGPPPLPPAAPVPQFPGLVRRTEREVGPGLGAGPAGRRGT